MRLIDKMVGTAVGRRLVDEWSQLNPIAVTADGGCCGCGADMADVHVFPANDPGPTYDPNGETYCWDCYTPCAERWAADGLAMTVFPGRQRWERR